MAIPSKRDLSGARLLVLLVGAINMEKTVLYTLLIIFSSIHSNGQVSVQSPLSADGGGQYQYLMKLGFGSPPREFALVVDTGSDLTWVQCLPCVQCFTQPDPLFDPTLSTTFSTIACNSSLCSALLMGDGSFHCDEGKEEDCRFTYGYADGSYIDGKLANERVSFTSSTSLHLVVGCVSNERMASFGSADGVVGLGRGPLSLPAQLSIQSVAQVFSYCLVDVFSRGTISSQIVFGEAARNSAAMFTPMLANHDSGLYYVGVDGISIGGHRVSIPNSTFHLHSSGRGGVCLDSGTSLSQWNTRAFMPMLAAFRQQIISQEVTPVRQDYELCYNISGILESNINFPEMVVHMTNVDFVVPVPNLFVHVPGDESIVCLTMQSSTGDSSLLGAVQQQNNLILFDVENEQIGFMPTDCGS